VGTQESGIKTPSLWNRLAGSPEAADLDAPLAASPEGKVDQKWWNQFDDPTLDFLITEALADNKTLQIAKARVEEARAGRRAALSSLLPQISGALGAQRVELGSFTGYKEVSLSEGGIEGSWEFDLFGRNQARAAAATAILQSEQAAQQAVRVGLLAEVARNYFDMRNYERQIDITKQNLETQKRHWNLYKTKNKKPKPAISMFNAQALRYR
jgi:multidrug efflux system outer membrane protein